MSHCDFEVRLTSYQDEIEAYVCYALLALCPGLQNRTFSRVHYTYYQMHLILLAPGIIFDQSVFVIS